MTTGGKFADSIGAEETGRVDPAQTAFTSAGDLAAALRRAAAAHGQHEKGIGHADANWPAWYAEYIVQEQSGAKLPK